MDRGLQPGTYSLRLAKDPSPLVGVNLRGVPEQPVVTDGAFRVWVVDKEDDAYILSIGDPEGNWFAQEKDKEVVGVKGDRVRWFVEGPEGGPYIIRVYSLTYLPLLWTVATPDQPGSPVLIEPNPGEPLENQKWYFVAPQE